MAELIPFKKGGKLERRESVSGIMLTPFLVLILVFLFSALGSALEGG